MAKKTTPAPAKFVTEEKFNQLAESVGSLVELVKQGLKDSAEAKEKAEAVPPTPAVIAHEKEIKKAGPKYFTPVNPEWEEKAREIIGDAVERCEMEHLRSGGLLFTVVIKREMSNASDDYLKAHKEDRRTREIGTEGIGGVENWCKLIKTNLSRGKTYVSDN